MKFLLALLGVLTLSVCSAQKFNPDVLIGGWRASGSQSVPMVFIFSNKSTGEKGFLKNWNNPTDFRYKTSFTYTISYAPPDSLTGNPDIDQNLFLLTQTVKTLTGRTEVQSYLLHIATKDSIGLVLTQGFITPFNRLN